MSSESGYPTENTLDTLDSNYQPGNSYGESPYYHTTTHRSSDALKTFAEMWYQVFLCALFSSIFVHVIAAAIAFATLRKHKFGKFFPIFILVMGVFVPVTSGSVSSAAIAFVYRASSLPMAAWYPLVWGVGHTLLAACIGFTRILATL